MRKVYSSILIALLVMVFGVIAFLLVNYGSFIKSFFNPPTGGINVLLLGKGGAGHEAPDLTDTIILASIGDEKISLISLPRDIWVPEIRAKLNSAYYWGKQKNEGFGLVDESVGKITGQPVNYNLVLDFSIFKRIVDSVGGIEVNVQNSFVDEKYPMPGRENDLCGGDKLFRCRYETVRFEKGVQMMDGETALKFVRSRNADGDEGTDFAREVRQQLILTAIQTKLSSPEVYLSPKVLKSLWKSIVSSTETDIPKSSLGGIIRKAVDSKGAMETKVIPEEFLFNPPLSKRYDNQYVFVPEAGDWSEVQKWIQGAISL